VRAIFSDAFAGLRRESMDARRGDKAKIPDAVFSSLDVAQ
jgi:hypothetical protein